ncbi:hypothetical protein [Paenibacillus anseongense]|uniref:hypothetical protein n=1 Tax=Paenibacillus anseongense TaxID=2682845 RepID=UPI002DB5B69E|nr:hypothetical protein [Paenibacillus anseongense]MEC0266721.1 hypothetical protein [Paenibacillus anseongense]
MSSNTTTYKLLLHHGTDDLSTNSILDSGFDYPARKRDDHWLGNGIYFYREDVEQALIWSYIKFRKNRECQEICVLQTLVEVEEDNFLNLDSRGGMERLEKFLKEIKELTASIKLKTTPVKLRHLIMGMLPQEYKVIQRTFPVKSIFDEIDLFNQMDLRLQGVQVCVRNKGVITGDTDVVVRKGLNRDSA